MWVMIALSISKSDKIVHKIKVRIRIGIYKSGSIKDNEYNIVQ